MDALSDLLQVVKLNGALFLDSRFTAPWCVESRPAREWRRENVERFDKRPAIFLLTA